jgi:GNAT superfamily N-acetyltransferase
MMSSGRFLLVDESLQGGEPPLAACVYMKHTGDRAYFGLLSVRPERQGRGLGKRLIHTVETFGRAAGCREMEIHIVNLREELPPFYRSLGYVERGTRPFPEDGGATRPCHFIVMTKSLAP